MNSSKFRTLTDELFKVSLLTYLGLLLIEALNYGFVSNVFDLNIILWIVLGSGIIKILPFIREKFNNQWEIIDSTFLKLTSQIHIRRKFSENDFYFILIVILCGGSLILYKTNVLGTVSYIMTGITVVLLTLFAYLIFTDHKSSQL